VPGTRRSRHRLIVASLALAAALLAPPWLAARAARASVRGCPSTTFTRAGLASVSTILSVRDMTCSAALAQVRRYGPAARGREVFRRGGRFRLGTFRCTVYLVDYEDRRARCVAGARAFRVDYGS